jgi:hypothetical protein
MRFLQRTTTRRFGGCNHRSARAVFALLRLSGVVKPGSKNDGTWTGTPNNIYSPGRVRLCAYKYRHAELYSVRDY